MKSTKSKLSPGGVVSVPSFASPSAESRPKKCTGY